MWRWSSGWTCAAGTPAVVDLPMAGVRLRSLARDHRRATGLQAIAEGEARWLRKRVDANRAQIETPARSVADRAPAGRGVMGK